MIIRFHVFGFSNGRGILRQLCVIKGIKIQEKWISGFTYVNPISALIKEQPYEII